VDVKIAILLPDAELGGAQKVLLGLADEFSKSNSLQYIFLVKTGSLQANLHVSIARTYLSNKHSMNVFDLIAVFYKLVHFMRNESDVKIVSSGTGTNLLACAARIFSGKRCSLFIREACSSRNSENFFIPLFQKILYRFADGCIGVSDGVAKELAELTQGKVAVASIPNPIDAIKTKQLAECVDSQSANFPYAYVLTVGRLVPQKNTDMLIDAYAKISTKVSEHLVIIGAGRLEAELRRRITQHGLNSKIHLLGEIANPHPWYKRANAFVLSSDSEGYPNVLLEALAHGLPVVATDCEFGPRQILENGRYGKLVNVGDVDGMADAIRMTLKGNMAFDVWDASRFTTSAIAVRYLTFMEDC
jgi:glycosyltransferase involved in cell wall biosynthesis